MNKIHKLVVEKNTWKGQWTLDTNIRQTNVWHKKSSYLFKVQNMISSRKSCHASNPKPNNPQPHTSLTRITLILSRWQRWCWGLWLGLIVAICRSLGQSRSGGWCFSAEKTKGEIKQNQLGRQPRGTPALAHCWFESQRHRLRHWLGGLERRR